MISFHQLLSISFLLVCVSQSLSRPVFGTKRYGRATGAPATHRAPPYAHMPIQPTTLNHYPSPSYYTDSLKYPPYSPDYDMEYYYPPEPTYNYPLTPYYPSPAAAPTSGDDSLKYAIYQSLIPFYYDARRPAYGYYGPEVNPRDGLQEEIQQNGDIEERGEALPIGQETWFEDSVHRPEQSPPEQESMAEANAAFLQNLILSQMYSDAQSREDAATRRRNLGIEEPGNGEPYPAYDETATRAGNAGYYGDDYEDQDVKELKSLVKKTNANNNNNNNGGRLIRVPRRRDDEKIYYGKPMTDVSSWDLSNNKRSVQYGKIMDAPLKRKPYSNWIPTSFTQAEEITPFEDDKALPEGGDADNDEVTASTAPTVPVTTATTTEAPDFDARRGQKEVPLLRPAVPTRLPLVADVLAKATEERAEGKNASVFETIKQLLSMEDSLRQDSDERLLRQPQKRFVTNEESLVDQLDNLRKFAA